LLDATETAFFFLYFHDDIITPNYTARLLEALRGRRDAASAHCDVGHFGESEDISVGRGYEGSAAERLASFLVAPPRGAPLRSMTRRSAAEDLRMPTDGAAGFWANHPYLMALVVAGPALHVPEVLYKRWDQRKGGLTDGWRGLTPQEMRDGLRANTKAALAVVDRATTSAAEREMLRFCAFLFLMQVVRNVEAQRGTNLFESPGELHESFAAMAPPPALENSTAEIREWARASYSNLTSFPEGRRR
jgi:hypothetical protein